MHTVDKPFMDKSDVPPAKPNGHARSDDAASLNAPASNEAALRADIIIKNHVVAAMAAGLVPLPLVFDMVAVTVIEVRMITEMAKTFSAPVPHRQVLYKILISIVGGVGPAYLSAKFASLIKMIPVVGDVIYLSALVVSGGASVYAVGKVFQKHFESGGTFLSKDNEVIRHYFKEKHAEGKEIIPSLVTVQ